MVHQAGVIDDAPTRSRFVPTAAMDAHGTLALAYTGASPTEHPSVYAAARTAYDALDTLRPEQRIAKGAAPAYQGSRWGDYAGMTSDPTEPGVFYVAASFSPWSTDNWAVQVARLEVLGDRTERVFQAVDGCGDVLNNATCVQLVTRVR